MEPTRHARLSALFQEACELDASERAAFLDRNCPDDPELRAEVEALLARDSADSRVTERLAEPVRRGAAEAERPRRIGSYRIVRELGTGGAGTVFEAHDERMDRRVALKVLSQAAAASERASHRFEREAWIAGKLSHAGIVRVFERGVIDNRAFYAMELVDGGSLHDVIESMRRFGRDERLELAFGSREYLEWAIRQVILAARALDHAHGEGVVHRDVKPMNLLLDGQPPRVRVADFGIAIAEDRTRLTSEGHALGTLRYMAPEQLFGDSDAMGPRTDIYALGVTLFELLTLEYPYRGDTHQRYMNAVLSEPARRPGRINEHVGRDLEVVLARALEKDARDRYATAGAFADDLENVLHFRPIRARPASPLDRTLKWIRRKPIHAALTAVLVLGLPTVGVIGWRVVQQQRQLDQTALADLLRRVNEHAAMRENESMIEAARALLSLQPDQSTALRSLASGYFNLALAREDPARAENDRNEALSWVDRWIAAEPTSRGPLRLKAYILAEFGRAEEAAEIERAAAALPGGGEDDLFHEAVLAKDRGDLVEAERLFSQVIRQRPRTDASLHRASVRRRLGDNAGAVGDYRAVLSKEPDRLLCLRELARLHYEERRWDDARQYLEDAARLAPDDPIVHERYAVYAVNHGDERYSAGDPEGARARYDEAVRHGRRCVALAPDLPGPHIALGAALIGLYRTHDAPESAWIDEALEHYDSARTLAEKAPDTQTAERLAATAINTCDALIRLEELDRARGACEQAVDMAHSNPDAHYNLAAVHALQGRPDEAMAELELDVALGDTEYGYLLEDTWFESLQTDARFQDLLARMKRAAGDE